MKETPPRLLILLNRFVIGGQALDTLPLAYFLQPHFNVTIAYGQKEHDEIEPSFLLEQFPHLTLKKITCLKRSINPLVDVIAFFQILQLIVQTSPHIVHTHGAKSGLIGRLAAFLCRVPVVVHTFHGHLFHSYFSKKISNLVKGTERFLAKITTGFIVLSPSQFNELVNGFKILPANKGTIIPLGLIKNDHEDASLFRKNFRSKYHLADKDVAIGIVGRIVPIKNHQFFIRVINNILSDATTRKPAFFIIGDGDLKEELLTTLKHLQISFSHEFVTEDCRVIFTSWLENIPEVMCGLDIIALTSLNEGTPLSIIEAQAYGKPVIATNVGGVKDTMLNNQTGFYVDRDDIKGFTEKTQLLVINAQLRAEMGAQGKKFVSEKFSKQKEVDLTREFYFSLLAKKGL